MSNKQTDEVTHLKVEWVRIWRIVVSFMTAINGKELPWWKLIPSFSWIPWHVPPHKIDELLKKRLSLPTESKEVK